MKLLKIKTGGGRKAVSISQDSLIKTSYLSSDNPLPLIIQPAVDGLSLVEWTANNKEFIEYHLSKEGGILFADFNVKTVDEFENILKTLSGELMNYIYRSTPRTLLKGRVFTSTHYPADQTIPCHNEMAYSKIWPMKISLYCMIPPENGGETPIYDCRKIYQRIDPHIRNKFAEKGVLYVRNYIPGMDLSWQEVFQTDSRNDVENFCRRADMEFEWLGGDRLRTRQVCQGVAKHPKTGDMVWFNQAHLFHISNLKSEVREAMLSSVNENDMPRNAYFGDGTPIEITVLDEIRCIMNEEEVATPWRKGNVVLCDNMLVGHGRRPFTGERKILVAMAEPYSEGNS